MYECKRSEMYCYLLIATLIVVAAVGLAYDSNSFSYEDGPGADDEELSYGRQAAPRPLPIRVAERLLWPNIHQYLVILDSLATDPRADVGPICGQQLRTLADGIRSKKLFAYRFLDATSRGHSGLLSDDGQLSDIGSISGCVDNPAETMSTPERTTPLGKHCTLALAMVGDKLSEKASPLERELRRRSPFNFGLCIPMSCEPVAIERGLQKYLKETDLKVTISRDCVTKELGSSHGSVDVIAAAACLTALLVLVVTSSYLDDPSRISDKQQSPMQRFLVNFSLKRNCSKLFSDFEDGANRSLYFVHGIRSLFAIVSVWLNLWLFKTMFMSTRSGTAGLNSSHLIQIANRLALEVNDVMFVISGLLVVYTWLPQFERSTVTFGRYLMTRWFRTTPTLVGVLLLTTATSKVTRTASTCTAWWSPLLYVNNWMHPMDSCLPATWYLSVDFQLYILSYAALVLLARRPRIALCMFAILTLLGLIAPELATYYLGSPNDDVLIVRGHRFLNYFASYSHLSTFAVGILVGYAHLKNIRPSSERTWQVSWVVATIAMVASLVYKNGSNSNVSDLAINSLCRAVSNAVIGWTLFALARGRANLAQYFLSRRVHVPLSRMAFSVYACQTVVVTLDEVLSPPAHSMTWYFVITKTLYVSVICCLLGVVVHLTLEAPSVCGLRSWMSLVKFDEQSIAKDKRKRTNNNSKGANLLHMSEVSSIGLAHRKGL